MLVLVLALGLDVTVARSTPLKRPPLRLSPLQAFTANHVPIKHITGSQTFPGSTVADIVRKTVHINNFLISHSILLSLSTVQSEVCGLP